MTFELTARCSASELLVHFVVEVVGVEPTRLSDLIYSQASQPNAQHFLIFTKIILFFNYQKFCPPGRLRSDSPHIKSMVLSRLSYEGFCLSYLSLSITLVFICLFLFISRDTRTRTWTMSTSQKWRLTN